MPKLHRPSTIETRHASGFRHNWHNLLKELKNKDTLKLFSKKALLPLPPPDIKCNAPNARESDSLQCDTYHRGGGGGPATLWQASRGGYLGNLCAGLHVYYAHAMFQQFEKSKIAHRDFVILFVSRLVFP
jgi:hypothetical protein